MRFWDLALAALATIALVGMKLSDTGPVAAWSWSWCTAPAWGWLALALLRGTAAMIVDETKREP